MIKKYYIYDCNGFRIGGKRGFTAHKGADTKANSFEIQRVLWDRFHNREDKSKKLVWRIVEEVIHEV